MEKRGENHICGKGCVNEGYKKTHDRQANKEGQEHERCLRCCMNEVIREKVEERRKGKDIQWKGACMGQCVTKLVDGECGRKCREGLGHKGRCECYECGEELGDIIIYVQDRKGERMAIGVGMKTTREEIEQRITEPRFGMEEGVTIKLGGREWGKQDTVRQNKHRKRGGSQIPKRERRGTDKGGQGIELHNYD